jgi:Asp-tRNA(Asn)/Glu-tRNA(Gln) amidotransferase A subunit family amidase
MYLMRFLNRKQLSVQKAVDERIEAMVWQVNLAGMVIAIKDNICYKGS